MSKYYITIVAGGKNQIMLPPGTSLRLKKEPENSFDNEAIQAIWHNETLGKDIIFYVSNSYKTRDQSIIECISAGRLYDKFSEVCFAIITKDAGNIAEVIFTENKPTPESKLKLK